MRTEIETQKKFTLRLEDIIYFLFGIFIFLIGLFISNIIRHNSLPTSNIWIKAVIISAAIGIGIPSLFIFLSYRKRLKDRYYFENGSILRKRDEQIIFRIPIEKIVSVRLNNKKGNTGTIILFTNEASKNYFFTYTPFNMMIPIALYGLTKNKINLALDRKKIVTEIYKVNPKLNFIETY
jgi:hypothetical protein